MPDKLLIVSRKKDIRVRQLSSKNSLNEHDMVSGFHTKNPYEIKFVKITHTVSIFSTTSIHIANLSDRLMLFSYSNFQVIPIDGLKSTIAIDWCQKTDTIFWTDVGRSTISRAQLNGGNQTQIIQSNLST